MKHLDTVDSEGGPILIADARLAQLWRGCDGSDYERACLLLANEETQGASITIGSGLGVLWELEGAGTADVYSNEEGHILILRAWLNDSADERMTLQRMAELPFQQPDELGSLEIASGVLAILWAPESGDCIQTLEIDHYARPTGDMATASAGLLLKVTNGKYMCLHDKIVMEDGQEVRRCHVILICSP